MLFLIVHLPNGVLVLFLTVHCQTGSWCCRLTRTAPLSKGDKATADRHYSAAVHRPSPLPPPRPTGLCRWTATALPPLLPSYPSPPPCLDDRHLPACMGWVEGGVGGRREGTGGCALDPLPSGLQNGNSCAR